MPVAVNDQRLAASLGSDSKRIAIRRHVAEDFLSTHLFEVEGNWQIVRRALQCVDFAQPIVIGPYPPPPRRVAGLAAHSAFGAGFFSLEAPKGVTPVDWWLIAPEAPYMKWFAPFIANDDSARAGKPGEGRLFVPAARTKAGARLVIRDRS